MADPSLGTIVHAADLHLGAPLASLGLRLDATRAAHIRRLAAQAIERLVEVTVAAEASALVLAGDVYDDAEREVGAQLRFHRCLERLADVGIPVFIAHGNHDPLVGSHRPARPLPPNVTVFPAGRVDDHLVELRGGAAAVRIAGTSFTTAHEAENLALRFGPLPRTAEPRIGVLHANVHGTSGHDPYAPCSVDDLAAAPVTYWALGHVHQRTVQPLAPGRWWAYPGNLQGRSTKPAECGPKGALLVPVLADGVAEPVLAACDVVRFERVDVDVAGAVDVGDALDAVRHALSALVGDGTPARLVRVRLVGACTAHADLSRVSDLRATVRDELGDLLGEGELLHVENATSPHISRQQLLERDDLLSRLLQQIDVLRVDGTAVPSAATLATLDRRTRDLLTDLVAADPAWRGALLDQVERLLVGGLGAS